MKHTIIPSEIIENKIFFIRGQKVMLDKHLAQLYGVPTGRLNEQVLRNLDRFPDDFMFQLTKDEHEILISQNAISRWGGTRKLPRVFTEQGIAMLSSVLHSPRAVQVNIAIMRAFVKLRELMISHRDLARKIEQLERKFEDHDHKITIIFDAIRQLLQKPSEPEKPKERIGFYKD